LWDIPGLVAFRLSWLFLVMMQLALAWLMLCRLTSTDGRLVVF
jgi:hypothetical protein